MYTVKDLYAELQLQRYDQNRMPIEVLCGDDIHQVTDANLVDGKLRFSTLPKENGADADIIESGIQEYPEGEKE